MPDRVWWDLSHEDMTATIEVYAEMQGQRQRVKPLDSLDRALIAEAKARPL